MSSPPVVATPNGTAYASGIFHAMAHWKSPASMKLPWFIAVSIVPISRQITRDFLSSGGHLSAHIRQCGRRPRSVGNSYELAVSSRSHFMRRMAGCDEAAISPDRG